MVSLCVVGATVNPEKEVDSVSCCGVGVGAACVEVAAVGVMAAEVGATVVRTVVVAIVVVGDTPIVVCCPCVLDCAAVLPDMVCVFSFLSMVTVSITVIDVLGVVNVVWVSFAGDFWVVVIVFMVVLTGSFVGILGEVLAGGVVMGIGHFVVLVLIWPVD